jgi:hypothetical protein
MGSRTIVMKPSVLLIAVAIFVVSFGCRSERTRTVPDELVGVWKTSEPRYADRFLELTRTSIAFGTGEGKADVRSVAAVEKAREDGKILYTVSYADPEGHESTFSFYYDPARAGVIRLKNQQSFEWTKQGR